MTATYPPDSALKWFWLRWASATLIGFLASLLWVEIGERPELGAIEGTLGGGAIGLAQGLVLSPWLPLGGRWAFVNSVSWGLMAGSGFGAMGWVVPQTEVLEMRLLFGAIWGWVGGFWLGLWQWLVLRQRLPGTWRWLAAVPLSWSVGLPLGWGIGSHLRSASHLFLGEVVGLAVTWAVVGAIEGIALKRLLRGSLD